MCIFTSGRLQIRLISRPCLTWLFSFGIFGNFVLNSRIVAVNGLSIDNMHHEEIIKQIKDSGYVVTLTIGAPQDTADEALIHQPQEINPALSSSSSSGLLHQHQPDQHMQHLDPTQPMQRPPRSIAATNGNLDQVDHPGLQYPVSKLHHNEQTDGAGNQMDGAGNTYLTIDLHRGNRGFGFSIRGGQVMTIIKNFEHLVTQ